MLYTCTLVVAANVVTCLIVFVAMRKMSTTLKAVRDVVERINRLPIPPKRTP